MHQQVVIGISIVLIVGIILLLRKKDKVDKYAPLTQFKTKASLMQIDKNLDMSPTGGMFNRQKFYFDMERDREIGDETLNGKDMRKPEQKIIDEDDRDVYVDDMTSGANKFIPAGISDLSGNIWKPLSKVMRPEFLDGSGDVQCLPSGWCKVLTPAATLSPNKSAMALIRDNEINTREKLELARIQKEVDLLKFL